MEKRVKRQREGIEAKKARGEWENYGRPRIMKLEAFQEKYQEVLDGRKRPFELMKELNMTQGTYYRYKRQIEEKSKIL